VPFHTLSEAQFQDAFWHESPIPLSIVDRAGRFVACNPAWTALLGYARSELEGRHFKDFTHPADIGGDEAEVARLLAEPDAEGYTMVKRYLHKHGPSVWVELHVRALRNAKQELDAFAVCVVPLPVAPQPLPAVPEPSLVRTLVLCFVDVVKARPREFLIATSLAFIVLGNVPMQPILEALEKFFLRP
jgi:PAS domain S-box-containing protein